MLVIVCSTNGSTKMLLINVYFYLRERNICEGSFFYLQTAAFFYFFKEIIENA